MFRARRFFLTSALTFWSATGYANPHPLKISDELDASIKAGLTELYNLRFDEALKIFDSIKDQSAEHPMVAFGIASVHWWKLSVYVLEGNPNESEAFLKAADECIRLSEKKIKKGDPTGEGHLTLGGVLGLLGRWKATNGQWVSAYFQGKKAIKVLRKTLEINPELSDAYMGLGIFDYYVATLPAVVRNLAFLGSKGDPAIGIKELHTAAEKGIYARIPAVLFLIDIYGNIENKPEESAVLLKDLRQEFPESPFIHMLEIFTHYNRNNLPDMQRQTADFQKKIQNKIYTEEFVPQVHFAQGLFHFKSKEWTQAIGEFDKAIDAGNSKNPFCTWARVYKGYALDILGARKEAVAEYKEVLDQPRRWGSHDNAKNRLKNPFKESEKEFQKVTL